MLKVQEIRELIKLVDHSSIDEFVFEQDGSKIKMKKNKAETTVVAQPINEIPVVETVKPQQSALSEVNQETPAEEKPAAREEAAPEATNLHKITSPMVGTFYQSSSPDTPAYVKVGSKVSNDSIVCIVEAMKLFNEIEAEVNGEIVEILVSDGQLVEYGQPLFLVKPE
ncbi:MULTISPECIES: acetyl-CoA carboxylase biotin carboxyl carrier protein [Bacillus]|uniref:acetyl-CoA carboxylase biotin carboxyl carrier protein n=1 Tax=Bacillus TaxID=1386 RepID=UPI000C77FF25|nr:MULTISPECIES: acetyl-CoA carboxylase biotin carboxyl carrier protein [Bacillus]PLR84486.1 acetyl-CoA carboxylase biotin carboxyl carrier protein [Bacillus sp. V33-4]RSK53377.1 acetyl-CoA carboxylase biotin carboxyl carrier protein [Bacillus canaveralius]